MWNSQFVLYITLHHQSEKAQKIIQINDQSIVEELLQQSANDKKEKKLTYSVI